MRCELVNGVQTCALPIFSGLRDVVEPAFCRRNPARDETLLDEAIFLDLDAVGFDGVFQFAKISHDWSPLPPRSTKRVIVVRSEEHTSELQSLMRISYAVFCLKNKNNMPSIEITNRAREPK